MTENSAVVFVSHNMQFVSNFCTRVVLMDHGNLVIDTPEPASAIDRYFGMVTLEKQNAGAGGACIEDVVLHLGGKMLTDAEPSVPANGDVSLYLNINIESEPTNVSLYIMDEGMAPIVHFPLLDEAGAVCVLPPGRSQLNIPMGALELSAGRYSLVIALTGSDSRTLFLRAQGICPFRVYADQVDWAKIVRPTHVSRQA